MSQKEIGKGLNREDQSDKGFNMAPLIHKGNTEIYKGGQFLNKKSKYASTNVSERDNS